LVLNIGIINGNNIRIAVVCRYGDKDMEEKELPFLVEGLLSGDNRSLTRLISLVEDIQA
jgi:hypothetical protein